MGTPQSALVLALCLLGAMGPRAAAQQDDPGALPADLVRSLNSPVLAERDAATARIVDGDPAARLAAVERALSDSSLSPEQRERLRTAGLRLFDSTPRAALGVTISANNGEGAVSISPSAPGFDAQRVLQNGDIVREADGRPIASDLDLRCIIVAHDPGDELALSIVRSGVPMLVKVKLGRFSDLGRSGTMEERVVLGAWDRRVERVSPPPEAPLASDATAARWAAALERARDTRAQRSEPMVDPSSQEPVRSPLFRPPTSTLSAGGQARDPAARSEGVAMDGRRAPQFVNAGDRAGLRDQARALRELQGAFSAQIAACEEQLARAGVNPDQRQQLRDQLDVLRAQSRAIEEQINLLQRLGR